MDDNEFWTRVATGDGCWEWKGTRSPKGYGLLWNGRRQVRAHRVAWTLASGQPIPPGRSVLHSCDNPPCVRPDHLRLGTIRENNADARERGHHFTPFRGQRQEGESNRNAKVTAEDVAHIRGLAAAGHYQDEIAARFGITRSNVSVIVRRVSWPDVGAVSYPPAVRDRPLGRSAPRRRAERG